MTENELIGLILGAGIVVIILIIALCIPVIIAEWKMFKKAGKNGWEIFIPFYNTWVLIEIAGLNWWYFLITIAGTILAFIGIDELTWLTNIASYFVSFLVYYNIAKKTKQNEILFGILGALVSFIPVLIIGFKKDITFDNSIEVSPNGIIGDQKTNNQQPERYCLGCGQKLPNNVKFCEHCGKKVEE